VCEAASISTKSIVEFESINFAAGSLSRSGCQSAVNVVQFAIFAKILAVLVFPIPLGQYNT